MKGLKYMKREIRWIYFDNCWVIWYSGGLVFFVSGLFFNLKIFYIVFVEDDVFVDLVWGGNFFVGIVFVIFRVEWLYIFKGYGWFVWIDFMEGVNIVVVC